MKLCFKKTKRKRIEKEREKEGKKKMISSGLSRGSGSTHLGVILAKAFDLCLYCPQYCPCFWVRLPAEEGKRVSALPASHHAVLPRTMMQAVWVTWPALNQLSSRRWGMSEP